MSSIICKRWAVSLNSFKPSLQQLCKAAAAVQPEERALLMKKCRYFDDFIQSLAGRIMMRKFVAEVTGIQYDAVKIELHENGKPFWVAPADKQDIKLEFDVSYENYLVVLSGIAVHGQQTQPFVIGVNVFQTDFSKARYWENYFKSMRAAYSSDEWDQIYLCTPGINAKLRAFTRFWALKESCSRVQGTTFVNNMGRLNFKLHSYERMLNTALLLDTEVFVDNELQTNYKCEEHYLANDFWATIAFRDVQVPPAPFEYLDLNALIGDCDLSTMPNLEDYCRRVLAKEHKQK